MSRVPRGAIRFAVPFWKNGKVNPTGGAEPQAPPVRGDFHMTFKRPLLIQVRPRPKARVATTTFIHGTELRRKQ